MCSTRSSSRTLPRWPAIAALYPALRSAEAAQANPSKDAHADKDPVPAHEKRGAYGPAGFTRLLAHDDGHEERLLGAYGGLRSAEMASLRRADVDPLPPGARSPWPPRSP